MQVIDNFIFLFIINHANLSLRKLIKNNKRRLKVNNDEKKKNKKITPAKDHIIRSFKGKINALQKKRGDAAEGKVFSALFVLKKAKVILSFLYTNQNNRLIKSLDYFGFDFVIFLSDGSARTLQVKSSYSGIKKFKKENLRNKTLVIQVDPWEDLESVVEKCLNLIFNSNPSISARQAIKIAQQRI